MALSISKRSDAFVPRCIIALGLVGLITAIVISAIFQKDPFTKNLILVYGFIMGVPALTFIMAPAWWALPQILKAETRKRTLVLTSLSGLLPLAMMVGAIIVQLNANYPDWSNAVKFCALGVTGVGPLVYVAQKRLRSLP